MAKPTICLLPILFALLALAGCDPAVQSRYQPTSVDEVFGSFSRIGGVDDEVYELPASPPGIDGASASRRSCRPPGQTMKPVDVVGWRVETRRDVTIDPLPLFAMEEPPMRSPPPGPAYRIASWQPHLEPGAKESIYTPPYSPKLEPGRSVQREPPRAMGSYRRDIWSWCYEAANQR
jgi:hypothetical protein